MEHAQVLTVQKKPVNVARWVMWILATGLMIFFIFAVVLPYFGFTEEALGRFYNVKWWLVGHIIGGLAALLLGPFQFIGSFRRKFLKFHKRSGRIYVGGIALAIACSLVLAFTSALAMHWTWTVSLLFLALAWGITTGKALTTILKKKVEEHKKWMIRSYIVTFSAVNFRWMFAVLMGAEAGNMVVLASVSLWISWAVPLIINEMIQRNKEKRDAYQQQQYA